MGSQRRLTIHHRVQLMLWHTSCAKVRKQTVVMESCSWSYKEKDFKVLKFVCKDLILTAVCRTIYDVLLRKYHLRPLPHLTSKQARGKSICNRLQSSNTQGTNSFFDISEDSLFTDTAHSGEGGVAHSQGNSQENCSLTSCSPHLNTVLLHISINYHWAPPTSQYIISIN